MMAISMKNNLKIQIINFQKQCKVRASNMLYNYKLRNTLYKDEIARDQWSSQCDFFLSCLGFAVGIGNVWRFPYLTYKHGGGSFIVAYLLMLFAIGLPLFFLELGLGQFASVGPAKVFGRMMPVAVGLGWGMIVVSGIIVVYYNMIIAWTLYYLYAGLSSVLPWTNCGLESSMGCYSKDQDDSCLKSSNFSAIYYNGGCSSLSSVCKMVEALAHNLTHCMKQGEHLPIERRPSTEDFYTHQMLGLEKEHSFDNLGHLQPHLIICLVSAWLLVAVCLFKGVKSSGKVVYFTAIYPFVILGILLVRGVTLPGAMEGIRWYITPVWGKLMDISVWADAATQIFFSLSPCCGVLVTLASYNKFDNNCHRDAIIVSIGNCATSIFAGFVIFSIVGFMAHELNLPIDQVVRSGPGLAFIAYPQAVIRMPLAPLWSFLFFTMLLTLGLDSQFAYTEALTTAIMDQWPVTRKHKAVLVFSVCAVCCLLGLPFCFNAGVLIFELIMTYNYWSLPLLGLFEALLVAWLYGSRKWLEDILEMGIDTGILSYYWRFTWSFLSPAVISVIFILAMIDYTPASFDSYVFPNHVQIIGWITALMPLVPVPLMAMAVYLTRKEKDVFSTSSWDSTCIDYN